MQLAIDILLWFSVIGCGLIAGIYFAFSSFIMRALGQIEQGFGIAAMNSINSRILGSLFMPLFFGTTLASVVLVVFGLFNRNEPGAASILAGGLIYVVGMFGCTVAFNVPLNNDLAKVGGNDAEAALVWRRYLQYWTFWNHVRTVASTATCGLLVTALLAPA